VGKKSVHGVVSNPIVLMFALPLQDAGQGNERSGNWQERFCRVRVCGHLHLPEQSQGGFRNWLGDAHKKSKGRRNFSAPTFLC